MLKSRSGRCLDRSGHRSFTVQVTVSTTVTLLQMPNVENPSCLRNHRTAWDPGYLSLAGQVGQCAGRNSSAFWQKPKPKPKPDETQTKPFTFTIFSRSASEMYLNVKRIRSSIKTMKFWSSEALLLLF